MSEGDVEREFQMVRTGGGRYEKYWCNIVEGTDTELISMLNYC